MFDKLFANLVKDNMPKLVAQAKQALHQELDKLDVDGDGKKDIDELKDYLTDIAHHVTEIVSIATSTYLLIKQLTEKLKP